MSHQLDSQEKGLLWNCDIYVVGHTWKLDLYILGSEQSKYVPSTKSYQPQETA